MNGSDHRPTSTRVGTISKVSGKTVTRRLSASEAPLYKERIDNDRKMRRLIAQMRQLAANAGEIRLAATAAG